MILSSRCINAGRRHVRRRPPPSTATAAATAPDLLVAATAAVAAAHRLVAAVGAHLGRLAAVDIAKPRGLLRPVVDPGRRLRLAGLAVDIGGLSRRAVGGARVAGRAVGGGGSCGRPVCSLTALALQPFERALADVSRSSATLTRTPVGDLVALLDVARAVADGVVAVALYPVLDVAVQLVDLVAVHVDLAAVDVLPIDVVEVDLAVEVAVVETVVAVDVDVVAVPAAPPYAPVIPVDGGGPDGACHRPGKERRRRIPVVGIRIGIVADRLPRIVRLVEHLRRILRDVDHLRVRRLDDHVVVLMDDFDLFVGLDHPLGDRLVAQLLDGDQQVLLLVGDGVAELLRPLEIVAHHLDDIRIVEQRDHAPVPGVLRLQALVLGVLVEVASRLHDLQRIERGAVITAISSSG